MEHLRIMRVFFILLMFFNVADTFSQVDSLYLFENKVDEMTNCNSRYDYEFLMKRDPLTGLIPENIHGREINFSNQIKKSGYSKTSGSQIVSWKSRGPADVGGRTRAIGIDINNEAILLAGSTTGGMWRSTDTGETWRRVTPMRELPSVSCIVQDRRKGKTNTWYYGTGEVGGNTGAYPLWLNDGPYRWGDYYGNGIYKSNDNGVTWKVLKSTANDSVGSLIHPFNFVHRIVVDVSDTVNDVLYAAVAGGIERSTDGGNTWTLVLGSFPPGSIFTDVAINSKGVVYAILGAVNGWLPPSPDYGIYRSIDGINWAKISPTGWIGKAYLGIDIPRSNENIVYFTYNLGNNNPRLLRYTYISGDGTGAGGILEDRSDSISGISFIYSFAVKPDDENTLFLGGVNLVRSTDGFITPSKMTDITPPHVDISTYCFFPSNPSKMLCGTDGGIYFIRNNMGNAVWQSLNNNYLTSQFYTVAIDHYGDGDSILVAGAQDHGNFTVISNSPGAKWKLLMGGDGSYCAIANNKSAYFISTQYGFTRRIEMNAGGAIDASARIDPDGGNNYLFINPYVLDPNNSNIMYMSVGNKLWRNDSLPAIQNGFSTPPSEHWSELMATATKSVGSIPVYISAIAVSRKPSNIVYYGTTDGQLFKIDQANVGNGVPVNIWNGKGFPSNAYISSIAVDSKDANKVLVAFANYNIQSLFYTTNGGTTWIPVGGNLEEFPDGKGNGPGFRTLSILHSGNGTIYLAGTTTGLYATELLNGMQTQWSLEGADTIGNSIINMIDSRGTDGLVAVATCGHGIFTGNFLADANGINMGDNLTENIMIFPNPAYQQINISGLDRNVEKLRVINIYGKQIQQYDVRSSEKFVLEVSDYPNGIYLLEFTIGNGTIMKKIIKQ